MQSRTSILVLLLFGFLFFMNGQTLGNEKAKGQAAGRNPSKSAPKTLSEFESWLEKRAEKDLLFFKAEKFPPTQVRIEKVLEDQILVTRGMQQRAFDISEIQAIQWHPPEEEAALLKTASLAYLREACEFRAPILHLMDHNEEDWVLAYLWRLLTAHSGLDHAIEIQSALKLLSENQKDVKDFTNEVLKYRSHRILPVDTTLKPEVHEAKYFIESGRKLPSFMMLHYLAQLAALEDASRIEVEEEHPKWRDDEEVKPVRQRHFQLAMDMNLYPYLFESGDEEAASEGLLRAGKIAHHAGEVEVARQLWTDLIQTYPKTTAFKEATRMVASLPQPESPAKPSEGEVAIPDQPSDDPPPKFLRFNLFEE